MKRILLLLVLVCLEKGLHAQTPRTPYIYTIKADSVKITNTCDTAELIIENHTQSVPGFLFNKGRGRTEFRRGLLKLTDSVYVVGGDTLRMNPWLQGGNRFGTTGSFGTMDNNPIDFYTNGSQVGRWGNSGNLIIGATGDEGQKFQVRGTIGAGVSINPNLSRPGDRIMIGPYINVTDGQNALFRTSNDYGATYKNVLVERDGNIGMGINAPGGWVVGNPTIRCLDNGKVSFITPTIFYGNTDGPWNSSALVTEVSDISEWWADEHNYPEGKNHYYFGTRLNGNFSGAKRAPLWISGRELLFKTGANEGSLSSVPPAVKIAENNNVLIGTETDYGFKLAVEGSTYSKYFTNSTAPLGQDGTGDAGVRLRWGGGSGAYIEFYNQLNMNRRGYICSPADSRPLGIVDSLGFSFFNTPFVSVGTEVSVAKLTVLDVFNTTKDLFGVCRANSTGDFQRDLTVKPSGNTIVGNNSYGTTIPDNGNKLQVLGSAYVRDTLKLPNLVTQTEMASYKPLVADASGNVYKMSGWNASAARKSTYVTAESYIVPSDVDVVFVNYASGTATISLPSGTLDREITIKNLNTINAVAISGLDANESNTIATRGAITVKFTGSTWVGISKY
ncbi:hypothetical protein A4D02_32230 [Niastella koreensis]|uniref:Uncharacterized protein n=2 Tax=Niastella koreensis TaxID=354356 RepID=G8TBX7_NIAKG|nr:hypothetical protein [Niastella koreensis]AEV99270.1 hypothetical protein Niako_2939 [Niastella koreensis GR20-10]OQP46059.1 hypothetical protein A4D02_32230 [Niastella koreensis]